MDRLTLLAVRIPVGIVILFAVIFAFKEVLFEQRSRKARPGGFEVKLKTGVSPVTQRKDNDHG